MINNSDIKAAVAEAEKAVKTSFMKWQPEWDTAAAAYDRAGNLARSTKDLQLAHDLFVKACECHCKAEATFFGARSMESAAAVW